MMKKIIVATDPGVSGATAIRWDDGRHNVWSWGGEAEFLDLVQLIKDASLDFEIVWFVEHPPKTTGRGRPESTGFVLGENFGFIKGAVQQAGLRMQLVRPQDWQASYSGIKGKEYKVRKKMCREEAKRLFPSPCRVTNDTADAWLILNHAVTNNK